MTNSSGIALLEAAPAPAPATSASELCLHRVSGVTDRGTPRFDGVADARVLPLVPLPAVPEGMTAVCKPLPGDEGLAVLGYLLPADLARAAAAAPVTGDLVLRTGRSELRLHADGRVRLRADDVNVQSNGRLALAGAFIELN